MSSPGGGQSEGQRYISAQTSALSLKRLQREEDQILKQEADRQRMLESGRRGRTSLLTSGFTGPGNIVRKARAENRASERATQRSKVDQRNTAAPTVGLRNNPNTRFWDLVAKGTASA